MFNGLLIDQLMLLETAYSFVSNCEHIIFKFMWKCFRI